MTDLTQHFDEFVDAISLKDAQIERIESAWQTLADYLRDVYDLPADNVYLQGSYANQTAVEPVEGGEYDVDVVCVCADEADSADDALGNLERYLRDNGRYEDRIVLKKPCVRLKYADDEVGAFHVDVVPLKQTDQKLEAPRRQDGWHETDPAAYTEWCGLQGDHFLRTVKILKRWRDENQTVRSAIKSIVLQVLISTVVSNDNDDDQTRVADTFAELHAWLSPLSTAPTIPNPVLDTEDLAERWEDDSFRNFVEALGEAVELSRSAVASDDPIEASDAWRDLLGGDFPMIEAAALGLKVSDYGHVRKPNEQGWIFVLDPKISVSVTGQVQRGKRDQRWRPYLSKTTVVSAGHTLKFTAHVEGASASDVWWQVGNTGEHARVKKELRGGFFRAKRLAANSLSSDRRINWERTSYTGSHLIRAVVVVNDVMVARSDWFVVQIYNKFWPFRR